MKVGDVYIFLYYGYRIALFGLDLSKASTVLCLTNYLS